MKALSPLRCSFLGAALAFAGMPASALGAAPTDGAWSGLVTSPSRQVTSVDVSFESKQATLHFGEPANCRIVAALLYHEQEQSFYRFHPSQNGGAFCTGLYPGEFTVTRAAAEAATVLFNRGDASWSGTLAPAGKP